MPVSSQKKKSWLIICSSLSRLNDIRKSIFCAELKASHTSSVKTRRCKSAETHDANFNEINLNIAIKKKRERVNCFATIYNHHQQWNSYHLLQLSLSLSPAWCKKKNVKLNESPKVTSSSIFYSSPSVNPYGEITCNYYSSSHHNFPPVYSQHRFDGML